MATSYPSGWSWQRGWRGPLSEAGWLTARRADVRGALAVVEGLCGISVPLTILGLREFRVLWQAAPGEPLGPMHMAFGCLVCVSVFCFLSGAIFTLAARLAEQTRAVPQGTESSYVYLLETGGFAVGDLVTSILLLHVFTGVQIACRWRSYAFALGPHYFSE